MVLLDTPGLHKPKAELGSRLNRLVYGSLAEADVICFVIDATQPVGPGDRLIAKRVADAGTPSSWLSTRSTGPDRPGDSAAGQSERLGFRRIRADQRPRGRWDGGAGHRS